MWSILLTSLRVLTGWNVADTFTFVELFRKGEGDGEKARTSSVCQR